ncbi:hypothetical protein [uncultured Ilumatobacter sp.]|mgnify:FL=1|jgi:hypothetical protein|uniref:hypothetical protein n=1 Tax=uncultured Ilumatobacter sp. TaxID=879968 RepID=UPI00374EE800
MSDGFDELTAGLHELATAQRDAVIAMLSYLTDDDLHRVAEIVRQVQTERAVVGGDHDAIIGAAFETGFGRDGLGVLPWTEGDLIVCPGGLVSKSRASHRCRFVSVNNCWIWASGHLLREDKRSSPGTDEGFRAIALLPLVDGLELDVVSGRARQGQHSVENVVSYEVRSGELIEVSRRAVNSNHGGRQIS